MKILFKTAEDSDGFARHEVVINDNTTIRIHSLCDCPEDAIIGRDLIDGGQIIRYMKMAYEAGANGEPFTVENGKMED